MSKFHGIFSADAGSQGKRPCRSLSDRQNARLQENLLAAGDAVGDSRFLSRQRVSLRIESTVIGYFSNGGKTMPRSVKNKWACLFVAIAVILAGAVGWFVYRSADESGPFVLPRGSVPLRISKETSFVLDPLKKDGKTIDYLLALEEQCTPTDRPEENGFRAIVQVFGRKFLGNISDEHWNELCQKLSLNPSDTPQFEYVRLVDYIKNKLDATSPTVQKSEAYRISFSYEEPGKSTQEELEHLKSWLDQMEPAFPAVEQALHKPAYFIPPCRTDGRPDLMIVVLVQREMLYLLNDRIIYRLSVGKGSGAWDDVLSMYRAARFYSRQPFLNSFVLGVTFDAMASALAQRVVQSGLLNAEQLRQCLADLTDLPECASFESKIDAERLGMLQCISEFPERGPDAFRIAFVEKPPLLGSTQEAKDIFDSVDAHNKAAKEAIRIYRRIPFDWNIVAELVNAEYDETQGKKTKEELFLRHPDWKSPYDKEHTEPVTFAQYRKMSIEERSVVLAKMFYYSYVPKRQQFDLVHAKGTAALELTRTMLALECFRAKNNHYPETLESLVEGKILDKMPVDSYRQNETASLIYRREAPECYVLYSVGINGADNGGKHWKHIPPDDREWDDVVVEMP